MHFDYLHSALVEPILITNSLLALFSLFIHTFLTLTHSEVKKGNTDYKLVPAGNGKRKKKRKIIKKKQLRLIDNISSKCGRMDGSLTLTVKALQHVLPGKLTLIFHFSN